MWRKRKHLLANPYDESQKFIPVLNHCFIELQTLIQKMEVEYKDKITFKEFLYKLKILEKELYTVSHKLKETFRKNITLAKQLESEKEKSRKKTAKINLLESQLANAEFKLRCRNLSSHHKGDFNPHKTPVKPWVNYQCSARDSSDFKNLTTTVNYLRSTATATLNSIRKLISDFPESTETKFFIDNVVKQSENSTDIIKGAFKKKNGSQKKICEENQKLLDAQKLLTNKLADKLAKGTTNPSICLSNISLKSFESNIYVFNNFEDTKVEADNPTKLSSNFAEKLSISKQKNLKGFLRREKNLLKQAHCQKLTAALGLIEERNLKIQERIDKLFEK